MIMGVRRTVDLIGPDKHEVPPAGEATPAV